MFTGIIHHQGTVASVRTLSDDAIELDITTDMGSAVSEGDSIAVNGVCLTVMNPSKASVTFRLMHETVERTSLGDLKEGAVVNLEHALRAGDSLDGHFVQGHVDGIAEVTKIQEVGDDQVFTVQPDASLMDHLVPKGSVALDGVSLTVVDVTDDTFTVSLMPYTLEHTTLGQTKEGTQLNIETDMLAKHVTHLFEKRA